MRKEAFLRQLEYLLQDISEADRDEALNYYRDYLDEAGPENEETVLKEFGSPERIAAIIRSDANGNLEDGGSFTEKGYEDERFRDPNYQLAKRMDLPEEYMGAGRQSEKGFGERGSARPNQEWNEPKPAPRTSGCLKLVLAAILLVVAGPMLLGVGGTAIGVLTGVFVAAAVLLFLAALLTLVLLFSGAVVVGAGFAALFADPVEAVFAIGLGLVILGIGLLALVGSVWFYGKLIPWAFRGIGNMIDSVSNWARRRRA